MKASARKIYASKLNTQDSKPFFNTNGKSSFFPLFRKATPAFFNPNFIQKSPQTQQAQSLVKKTKRSPRLTIVSVGSGLSKKQLATITKEVQKALNATTRRAADRTLRKRA